jgi:membrane protease YdiL (CAAX protease family)
MRRNHARTLLTLAVFVAWVAITVGAPHLWRASSGPRSLDQSVSGAVQPALAAAIVFLLAAVAVFRWHDVGLAAPRPRSWRALWFPAIYVVLFVMGALAAGLPPPKVVLVILANTILVGISEELACRGVLYQGLRASLAPWPAILASTLLFGAVHVFNGFATGDFRAAAIQAVTAFMTGIAFLGIRLRTGSLYPVMVLHTLWDFTLVTTVVGAMARMEPGTTMPDAASFGIAIVIAPVLLIGPNFLYGIYLLRRAVREETMAAASPAPPPP